MQRDNLAALQPDSLIQLPQGGLITGHTKLNAPARAVWNIVGNFGGFAAFIPPLAWIEMTGSGVRSIRKKFFRDGNIVMEQLNARDDEKMQMSWTLLYTTFNIGNLWSSMRVQALNEQQCEVFWDIIADPWEGSEAARPEFNAFLEGFLGMAMSNLEGMFGQA